MTHHDKCLLNQDTRVLHLEKKARLNRILFALQWYSIRSGAISIGSTYTTLLVFKRGSSGVSIGAPFEGPFLFPGRTLWGSM